MATTKFRRPCIECGQLGAPGQSRCPLHIIDKRKLYNSQYAKDAAMVRALATNCHLCGEGARADDPWTADHINASDPASPLAAAHRSCNSRRGNTPL